MVDTSKCPCGSSIHYNDCCKAFHEGEKIAETAELLMRSRYSAYVKNNKDYLLETWHTSTRPDVKEFELDSNSEFRWLELEVIKTEAGTERDTEGLVHFQATYRFQGKTGKMQEASKFVKEDGKWFYIDGSVA
jgi:SEC-C motif-containing protein